MVFNQDVSTPAGIQALNSYLATRSYIDGFKPSSHDLEIAVKIKVADAHGHPHVHRWLSHIMSLPCNTLCALGHHIGKGKQTAAKGKSPAASPKKSPAKSPVKAPKKKDDDDSFSMSFDDDSDDGRDDDMEELLAKKKADAEAAKAAGKANGPIAKSTLVLDVKPNEAETDLDELEKKIRAEVSMDGLVWGKSEKVPIAYGVKKLRIGAVVEDEKVSVDELQEKIEAFDEFVQSTDVISFNKL